MAALGLVRSLGGARARAALLWMGLRGGLIAEDIHHPSPSRSARAKVLT